MNLAARNHLDNVLFLMPQPELLLPAQLYDDGSSRTSMFVCVTQPEELQDRARQPGRRRRNFP